MTRRTVHIIAGAALAVSVIAVITNLATGAKMFTRFEDEAIVESNERDELGDLFGETGLDEHHGELKAVDSGFALGCLPSGPGLASASVVTTVAPAAVVALGAWWLQRRLSRRRQSPIVTDAAAPANTPLERMNGHAQT